MTIPEAPAIDVVAQAESWVALDKPPYLLSVPGRGPEKADCVSARAQVHWPDALVVHRLDWETSGIILMARGKRAQSHISKQFQFRQIDKRYYAVVAGQPADAGTVTLPLIIDWPNRPHQKVCHDTGKEAITHWRVVERGADRALVALTPITGRSHQLRVHMAQIGHPILGDSLYAPPETIALADRLLLHAEDLAFTDPLTRERVELHHPRPPAFRVAKS